MDIPSKGSFDMCKGSSGISIKGWACQLPKNESNPILLACHPARGIHKSSFSLPANHQCWPGSMPCFKIQLLLSVLLLLSPSYLHPSSMDHCLPSMFMLGPFWSTSTLCWRDPEKMKPDRVVCCLSTGSPVPQGKLQLPTIACKAFHSLSLAP